jgi:hypothetical protein
MNCEHYALAIGDYVDGALQASGDARAHAELEAHLAGCERCRALVEDLRAIRTTARTLEPYVPSPGLWTKVAAGIEVRARRSWWSGLTEWPAGRLAFVAAALLLAVGVAGALLLQDAPAPQTASAGPGLEVTDAVPADESVDTQMKTAEAEYTEAIAGLEVITNAGGEELDADTADVLQANLTVIDEAIGESRAALETEPTSDLAQESLFEALRVKVALLQDTVALINEMRKGNQEAAARIVGELNQ